LDEDAVIEIDNVLPEIARVVGFLEAFAGRHRLPADVVFPMTLAVDELLTNTISYGFPGGGRHKISVSLAFNDGQLSAELVDDGVPFDPLTQPAPDVTGSLDSRPIGGLGIHFARTLLDHVDYRRANGQNRMVLRKRVPAATS
jgi:serine/threonine-protein kinase RsbW